MRSGHRVTAVAVYVVGRHTAPSPLATLAGFSVLRILVAPFLALAFFVCSLFSPYRFPRLAFLASAAMEMAVSAYAGFVWFVPMFFPRF